MNRTNGKLVYLAHPIDLGRLSPDLLQYAIGELQATATPSYDPLSAFNVSGEPSNVISRINEAAMDVATGAVAFLPSDTQSIGVPAEVNYLSGRFKPTLVVTDIHKSWVIAGWRSADHIKIVGLDEEEISDGISWLIDKMATHELLGLYDGPAPIIFGRVHPDAILPSRGYDTDAGYDLYTVGNWVIDPGDFMDLPCGVSVDLPAGTWGQVTGRSSTLRDRGLHVVQGVIDEEYTGPLFAGVKNLTDVPVTIKDGDRVAQLILHEASGQLYTPSWGTPRQKARGSNGFGSTGR